MVNSCSSPLLVSALIPCFAPYPLWCAFMLSWRFPSSCRPHRGACCCVPYPFLFLSFLYFPTSPFYSVYVKFCLDWLHSTSPLLTLGFFSPPLPLTSISPGSIFSHLSLHRHFTSRRVYQTPVPTSLCSLPFLHSFLTMHATFPFPHLMCFYVERSCRHIRQSSYLVRVESCHHFPLLFPSSACSLE